MWRPERLRTLQQGFTLIEMMAAMALSALVCVLAMSLWFGLHQSILVREKSGLGALGTQTMVMALDGMLERARVFQFQDKTHLVWMDWTGKEDTLWWDGDSLRLNDRVILQDSPTAVQMNVSGPEDSLLHRMTFEELDHDYSRTLDSMELSRAAFIQVQLDLPGGRSIQIVHAILAQNP